MSETGNFYIHGNNTYTPDYGDIDWLKRLHSVMKENDHEPKPPVYFEIGEYGWQITPENTMLWSNAAAPEFDVIELYDLRPGEEDRPIHFYRATTPTFDKILSIIYPDWCQEVRRPIPSHEIVVNGLKRFTRDLRKADRIPDDW